MIENEYIYQDVLNLLSKDIWTDSKWIAEQLGIRRSQVSRALCSIVNHYEIKKRPNLLDMRSYDYKLGEKKEK